MDTQKIKQLLEELLVKTNDASTKQQIQNLLTELDTSGNGVTVVTPSKIPESVIKKCLYIIGRFFLRIAERRAIDWTLDEFHELIERFHQWMDELHR